MSTLSLVSTTNAHDSLGWLACSVPWVQCSDLIRATFSTLLWSQCIATAHSTQEWSPGLGTGEFLTDFRCISTGIQREEGPICWLETLETNSCPVPRKAGFLAKVSGRLGVLGICVIEFGTRWREQGRKTCSSQNCGWHSWFFSLLHTPISKPVSTTFKASPEVTSVYLHYHHPRQTSAILQLVHSITSSN